MFSSCIVQCFAVCTLGIGGSAIKGYSSASKLSLDDVRDDSESDVVEE